MTTILDEMVAQRLVPPTSMKNLADVAMRSKKIQAKLYGLNNRIYHCFGRLQRLTDAIGDRNLLIQTKMVDTIDKMSRSMNCSKAIIGEKLHFLMGNNRNLNEERLALINLMPEVFEPANVLSGEGRAKASTSFYTSLQDILRKFGVPEQVRPKSRYLKNMVPFNTLLQKAFNVYTKTLNEKDSEMDGVDIELLCENIQTQLTAFRKNTKKVGEAITKHYQNLLQQNKSDEVHMETSKIIRSLLGEQMIHNIRMFELCSQKLVDVICPETDMSDKISQDIIFLLSRSIREVDRIARETADQVVPNHILYDIITDTFEVFGGSEPQEIHMEGSLRSQSQQYQSSDEHEGSDAEDQ